MKTLIPNALKIISDCPVRFCEVENFAIEVFRGNDVVIRYLNKNFKHDQSIGWELDIQKGHVDHHLQNTYHTLYSLQCLRPIMQT